MKSYEGFQEFVVFKGSSKESRKQGLGVAY